MPTLVGIDTDKTVEPCYKVSVMLMKELMEFDYWNKSDVVMTALMSEQNALLREGGALIFLHKAQEDSFNCNNFCHFVSNKSLDEYGLGKTKRLFVY